MNVYNPDDGGSYGQSKNASTKSIFELGSFMGVKIVYLTLSALLLCIFVCLLVACFMYLNRRRRMNKALESISLTVFKSAKSVSVLSPPAHSPRTLTSDVFVQKEDDPQPSYEVAI